MTEINMTPVVVVTLTRKCDIFNHQTVLLGVADSMETAWKYVERRHNSMMDPRLDLIKKIKYVIVHNNHSLIPGVLYEIEENGEIDFIEIDITTTYVNLGIS